MGPSSAAPGVANRTDGYALVSTVSPGTVFNSDFSDSHAFLWASPTSQGIDLNTVIPPGSGWELIVARSINNRGEISGAGVLNGEQHAVALIPVHGSSANALR